MSYNYNNYCNPYREDYQWKWNPFSCDKEVTAEKNNCAADRTELAKLRSKPACQTCPTQRACPLPVTCDAEKKSLSDLTARYDTLNKDYGAYKTKCTSEYSTLNNQYSNLQTRYDSIKNTTCPPQRICSPPVTCDVERKSLSDLTTRYDTLNQDYGAYKTNCTNDYSVLNNQYNNLNADYKALETRYNGIKNTTCPPQRVCPPPATCDIERKSLSELTARYDDLNQRYTSNQAELTNLRSATCPPYPSCPPAFKIPDDLQNNIIYTVTKTNNGWDLYKESRKLGSVERNDIQLLNNNNEPDSNQKFQKLKEGLKFYRYDCNGDAQITKIDNTINTIDYSCVNNTNKMGTLLSGPYKLNPAYTKIFDEVKEQLSAKAKESQDLKNNLKKDIDFLESKIGYLKKLKFLGHNEHLKLYQDQYDFSYYSAMYPKDSSAGNRYEIDSENSKYINTRTLGNSESCGNYHINYNNNTGLYSVDDFGIDCIVNNLEGEYDLKKSEYDTIEKEESNPLFHEYSRDKMLIDIINESKGNIDQVKSTIENLNYSRKQNFRRSPWDIIGTNSNYGNKRESEFDISSIANSKYISILGREFQFYEYPGQYEGETLQKLQIGDSFTIIDRL